MEVRPGGREDLPLIAKLIRGLAEYEKLSSEARFTEADLERTLFGRLRFAETLLAFEGEEAAGIAIYFFTYSTFLGQPCLYLEDLFVLPEMRKRGAGRLLFRRLIEIAEREQCGRMEWSVLDWNQPAIQFYEQIGAQAQKEWVRYRLDRKQIEALSRSQIQVGGENS